MKIITKWDIALIIIIAILGVSSIFFVSSESPGQHADIYVDGHLYGSYSLSQNREIALDGNTVAIKNGSVYMKDATCRGRDCVKQGAADCNGMSIICLPNRVVIEVKGEEGGYDAVSR